MGWAARLLNPQWCDDQVPSNWGSPLGADPAEAQRAKEERRRTMDGEKRKGKRARQAARRSEGTG